MNRSLPLRYSTGLSLTVCLFVHFTLTAGACDIPVFRYAIERWPTEPHRVMLATSVKVDINSLKSSPHANIMVARATSPQDQDVRISYFDTDTVWYEGPWTPGLLGQLVDSPLRRRIAHDLLTGTTAAWILLDGTAPQTNAAVAAMVKEQLDKFAATKVLTKTLANTDETKEDSKLHSKIPLHVAFTLYRIGAHDPQEQFLIRQIRGAEKTPTAPDQPTLVAVFGQGRMIPMPAGQLRPDVVASLCDFLCGDCSCQIKAMNPGLDLIMTVNWSDSVANYPASAQTLLPDGRTFTIGGTGVLDKAVFKADGRFTMPESGRGRNPQGM